MDRAERRRAAQVNVWAYAVVAWIGVIFFSSTSLAYELCEQAFASVSLLLFGRQAMQRPSFGVFHLIADKGLHVTLFLVLALLLSQALRPHKFRTVQILFIGFVVGSCSEFIQRFFPGRDPALRDVLINVAGTGLGVAVSVVAAKRRKNSTVPAK